MIKNKKGDLELKITFLIFIISTLSMLNAADLLPLPKDFQRNPQLYINKIDIDAELCGPLMKSIIEIEFYNPYDRDSLETRLSFKTNKESFVKELWLDIDGKYKVSENFTQRTGTAIYNRIAKIERKDPALLTTSGNGNFNLSVYPFLKGQSRKVKIEMYSTLDQKNDTLKWEFLPNVLHYNKNDFEINLYVTSKLPANSYVFFKDNKIKVEKENLEMRFNNNVDLKIQIPITNEKFLITNFDLKYLWDLNNVRNQWNKSDDIQFLSNDLTGKDLVKFLISNVKNENIRVYPTCSVNENLMNLIKFLNRKKNAQIYSLQLFNDEMRWIDEKDQIILRRFVTKSDYSFTDYVLYPLKQDESYIGELKCDYLTCFLDYKKLDKLNYKEKIKSGYLTPVSSKLVLEDNERVKRIREEEVTRAEKGLHKDEPPPPPAYHNFDNEILDFYSILAKPQLKVGMAILIENYIQTNYPVLARKNKIPGKVMLNYVCTKEGFTEDITIIMEKPAEMGFGEVAVNAIKLYGKFIPGFQRENPVAVRMTQMIDFKPDTNTKYSDNLKSKKNKIYLNNREFIFNYNDSTKISTFTDSSYKDEECILTKYMSDDYYEMIYNDPELLEIIWEFSSITFKHKEKWYRIVQ
jgi:hypothetical protein